MNRNWIAVASAEHVRSGREAGFMQVCHGKAAPLRRVKPGDRIVYYSPTERFQARDKLQALTAIGIVNPGEPYSFAMSDTFCPFRRDVIWLEAKEIPIASLLETLDFSAGKRNWGYEFRFGLVPISDRDLHLIAESMGARLPT